MRTHKREVYKLENEKVESTCIGGISALFLLDYTASMGGVINGIKNGVVALTDKIKSLSNDNYKLGLILFDENNAAPSYMSLATHHGMRIYKKK